MKTFDAFLVAVVCVVNLGFVGTVYGEPSEAAQIDAWMTAEQGQKGGALQKGELLVSALKREKVESASAVQAVQSLANLLDFRLSRSGDRYVYQVNGGRKLVMLRYQRGRHVYETVLNANGEYEGRLLDEADKKPLIQPAPWPDDDEVDAEKAVVDAGRLGNVEQPSAVVMQEMVDDANVVPAQAEGEMAAADAADATHAADDALDEKVSPDAAYPDTMPAADGDALWVPDDALPQAQEPEAAEAMMMPSEPDVRTNSQEELRSNHAGGTAETAQTAVRPITVKCRQEEAQPSVYGLVMGIMGGILFLIAVIAVFIPHYQARRRMHAQGLHVRDKIFITPTQQIVCVGYGDSAYLILLTKDKAQWIAACDDDEVALFDHLQTKVYWNEMANHPVSDKQLAAMIRDYHQRYEANDAAEEPSAPSSDNAGEEDDRDHGDEA